MYLHHFQLISMDNFEDLLNETLSEVEGSTLLVKLVQDKVQQNPHYYLSFIAILQKDQFQYWDILQKLEDTYTHEKEDRSHQYAPSCRSQSNEQIFEEALKRGYVLLNISKVITSGAAGSGKTCTKFVLLGKKPPAERTSTALFEVSTVFRDISQELVLVATDEKFQWFHVSYDQFNTMIAEALIKGVSHKATQNEEISDTTSDSEGESNTSDSVPELEHDTMDQSQSGITDHPPPTETMKAMHVDIKEVESKYTTRQGILQLMDDHMGSDELLRLHWIYFINSGGQPEFHDLLPAFVKSKSAILLVIKLSESLSEYPRIQYYRNGKMYGEYVSRSTNIQILQHYCRTLVSSNRDSIVVVVGTHRDCPCEESIDRKDAIIEQLLRYSLGNNLVEQSSEKRKILFPLNAKDPSEEDFEMAASLRSKITEESCSQQFKIPIAWLILEQDMQQLGKSVISMQDCIDLASKLKMNSQTLEAALEYFDKLNIILYFPSILPDVVFTSSQVIVDKTSEIVEFSFYLKGLEKENSERQQWSDFVNYGIVSRRMLSELFPKHHVDNLFTVDKLLHLFQHLLIVAQLNYHDFIMPAVLPEIPAEYLNRWQPPSVVPVLIYFPDGYAPGGAFCCLSVYLISQCGWQVADTFYRNCLKFELPANVTLTLIDKFHYFQVYLQGPPTLICSICKWVVASISSGLDKASVALNYDTINHQIAVPCPCNEDKIEHAATLDKQYWTCTKKFTTYGKIDKAFSPWHHLQEDQVKVSAQIGKSKKYRQSEKTSGDSELYLLRIGVLFALMISVVFISIFPTSYQLFHSDWSLPRHEDLPSESLMANSVPSRFHLPGMHFIHSKTFTLLHSSQVQTVDWERFGFKLHVPPEAFSEQYVNVTIGISLSGNFKLPANSTLVSAVYYVETSTKLLQPVTMEMEHCIIARSQENLQSLYFATATTYSDHPHYKFDILSGGVFSVSNSWGSIRVTSFSLNSIISRFTGFLGIAPPIIGYSAQIYQKKESAAIFNIRLVVTRHLSSCEDAVQTRYCKEQWILKKDFHFHFSESDDEQALSLDMGDDGLDSNGWRIKPSTPPPKISQSSIDAFEAASTLYDPAHCELSVWWDDESISPTSLRKDIKMKGIDKRSFLLMLTKSDFEESTSSVVQVEKNPTVSKEAVGTIDISAQQPEIPIMNDRPTMLQLQNLERKDGKESVRIIDKIGAQYQKLGTYLLNDETGQLLGTIKVNANGDIMEINRMIFSDWMAGKGKEVTWKTLVHVLGEQSQLKSLADDIVSALQSYTESH